MVKVSLRRKDGEAMKEKITISLDAEVLAALRKQAEESGRSLSNLINYLLLDCDSRPGEIVKGSAKG